MLIGYARVSTMDQNPALQIDALQAAGCEKIYIEKASGSHRERPQLKAALLIGSCIASPVAIWAGKTDGCSPFGTCIPGADRPSPWLQDRRYKL